MGNQLTNNSNNQFYQNQPESLKPFKNVSPRSNILSQQPFSPLLTFNPNSALKSQSPFVKQSPLPSYISQNCPKSSMQNLEFKPLDQQFSLRTTHMDLNQKKRNLVQNKSIGRQKQGRIRIQSKIEENNELSIRQTDQKGKTAFQLLVPRNISGIGSSHQTLQNDDKFIEDIMSWNKNLVQTQQNPQASLHLSIKSYKKSSIIQASELPLQLETIQEQSSQNSCRNIFGFRLQQIPRFMSSIFKEKQKETSSNEQE